MRVAGADDCWSPRRAPVRGQLRLALVLRCNVFSPTVVIGCLIIATALTLFVLPAVAHLVRHRDEDERG